MFTPPNNTLPLPLISIFILMIGFSISGCGDSADDEGLIEEEAEPLVVTIIDRWPFPPKRPDAEILADKILGQETEDFYFDIPQRNQLVGELERVLSLIRATYPPMNEIHAAEEAMPGALVVYLEQDFYEMLKEMLQDKQGLSRFETGYAEFDALNTKLGVQEVKLGSDLLRAVIFFFDKRLNLRVASEAYSMVEGVRRASAEGELEISTDIEAFKEGETWYFIFRNGWGDCPAGCSRQELFCFTVTGAAVEMIPMAQAQNMPPFQQGSWPLHNATPFFNATAHTWSWGEGWFSAGDSPDFDGFAGGCSLLGEIEASPNQLRVSCGYRVPEPLPRLERHDALEFTGVVLLLIATQDRTVIGNYEAYSSVVASEPVRVAKPAAEVQNPEKVYFEHVPMPINPPPPSAPFERWWGGVHPTFIVCWDHPKTGERAYQVLTPHIAWASTYEERNHPGCDNFKNPHLIQTLDIYLPTVGRRARPMWGLFAPGPPAPETWTAWVDEVLPHPAASE